MQNKEKFRFENLDSIRTIAFLSTFMAHAFYTESVEVKASTAFQWAVKFREVFSFGVPIFFVLSGFLITYLMLKEKEDQGGFSLKNFYIRRVLRIWPVYYLVLLVGFVLFPMLRGVFLDTAYVETATPWMYMSFLSNFDQINQGELPYGVGLGPTWSVSVEEQFYLFWPLLFILFRGKKFIYPLLLVLISSTFLTRMLGLPTKHLILCMIYLSVGGLFGYLSMYRNVVIKRITNIHPVFFLASAGLTLWLIQQSFQYSLNYIFVFLIAICIAYMIVYQCYSERFQLKRIPFLEKLGKYTYGLYLYHVICNFISHTLIGDVFHFEDNVITSVFVKPLLSLGFSLIISYYSYHYFESYFLKMKNRFSASK